MVAQGLVAAFRGVWRDSWGPRMEYILANALRLLLDAEIESLLGLQRLLVDSAYRAHLLRTCRDPIVERFWRLEFDAWDSRFRREAAAPIQNKLGQFLGDPAMRAILGQRRSKLDLRMSMDRRRVLLVTLSKGLVGETTANLFGSLLVASIHDAALSRADEPERERQPFLLAVDEFQNITSDRFAASLSEARKYGLGLALAHQYLDQLAPEVRSAVIGNVASALLFRMGGADAQVLARELGWPASRFADLASHRAVFWSSSAGIARADVLAAVGPRPVVRGSEAVTALMRRSAERFGADRGAVDRRIARWLERRF